MANRARKYRFNFYLTEDEYDLLKRKKELSNLPSMSAYIRSMIINGITFEVDYSELHRYNYLLSNLTNNLNQIAHQANASGNASNRDLEESKRIMEEVWRLQKSMLSDLQYRNL